MAIEMPVEPGLVMVFARAVGDTDPVYAEQLFVPPGTPLAVPPTFTRAMVEQFDSEGELRRVNEHDPVPAGGAPDRLHAEQHFEYLRPLVAGDRLIARSRPGETWRKQGSDRLLEFTEVHTDFVDAAGDVVVRSRRVGVRLLDPSA